MLAHTRTSPPQTWAWASASTSASASASADDRRERGAVLILVAICLTVLTTATAFTVDIGRIATERRDLQNTADAAALDVARRLDGRTAAELVADPAWDAALSASLARNGFVVGGDRTATAALGTWNATTATFTPAAGTDVPDAVRIELGDRVDYAFAPGGQDLTRPAVAQAGPKLVL